MASDPDLICGFVELTRTCEDHNVVDLFIEPGVLVRHPHRPDWGVGQVQSVVGAMVTVNFEEVGKQTINAEHIRLQYVSDDPRESR